MLDPDDPNDSNDSNDLNRSWRDILDPLWFTNPVREISMAAVQLHEAFSWDCPNCGQVNFGKSIEVELGDRKELLYRQEHDLEDWQSLPDDFDDLSYFAPPDKVKCIACSGIFHVALPEDEPE